jgi:hypothetical protein
MRKYDRLPPPIVPLVVSPILELGIVMEFGACSIVLKPIPAVLIEPTVHNFDRALPLVIAVVLEPLQQDLLSLLSHPHVHGAVELKVVPLVILAQILPSVVGARLVIILLKAKLCEESHGSVWTDKSKRLLILAHVHVGAGIFIGSKVPQRNRCKIIGKLLAFCC